MKSFSRVSILALAAAGACVPALSCSSVGNTSSEPSDSVNNAGDTGTVGLELQVGPGLTVNTVAYTITGPAGFSQTGSIDVSHSTTLVATIGGLPAGTGYGISLSATATDGATTCAGSATFNVAAHATTAVSVSLDCHQPPGTGSVLVNGQLNVCPVVDGVSAIPSQVSVGNSIALSGSAHDADGAPSPLVYAWSATSGTFSSASAQNPTFTCTVPGTSTITLTVSDGDTTAGCAGTLSTPVTCSVNVSGVVTSAALIPGSPTDPVVHAGYYSGAKVCVDGNNNGKCDSSEAPVVTDATGHFTLTVSSGAGLTADIGTGALNTANGSAPASRNVFRAAAAQIADQPTGVVLSPLSSEVVRQMEANGTDYPTEKQNLATRLGLTATQTLADVSTLTDGVQTTNLREATVLSERFRYAVTKLDRGDRYPDALAVPGGDPELTGLANVTAQTATTPEARAPITFAQAEQAAFNVEGIPRYDAIFIVMLENKSTQAILGSPFAPKINAYLAAGNFASSYYATGNPSEPNYTALGGGDDFGITDDSQWNCDATGPNAVQDLPVPDHNLLPNSPFQTTCTQTVGTNHNITGKPNLFNAISGAGMTWRTYNESMNPGQDIRTDSIADPAVTALDNVYAPGTLNGNTSAIGTAGLVLPMPAGLYKTKHHPGMAYQNVRSAPEFRYSNRTLGGGQWDAALASTSMYPIPSGYDKDQFSTDLASGNVGQLNFVIPDQCDDMHGITVKGTIPPSTTQVTASDCSSISNNQPVATGGNIITRGDNYVDYLVHKIQTSPLWTNGQKKVAIVLMFDEGNATNGLNSCCGWKAGKAATNAPLVQNPDGTWSQDPAGDSAHYKLGNQGHGKSIFGILTNQASAPKHIVDNDVYSHFSFVRTLQDMFLLADPAKDSSYMNRSKYTEKFVAQNILNLPEFTGSADTHFDSVRPMNHTFVIPAAYTEQQVGNTSGGTDDIRPLQVGPDATQTNIWAIK